MKKITIYTDGSSLGNPGNGGWGAILIYNDIKKEISGNAKNVTNNQMELLAAINSLKTLKEKCEVTLITDSTYVKNGITLWIKNWEKNNWQSANKKPVKNKELWQELANLNNQHQVKWQWVKGHSGDKYNDLVDNLARSAAEELNNN
ncbi:MAG: ribonuclease HI [Rickettsiales bacterium]|nr:ribonuclease HI [Rickettsiales bacterium]